MTLEYRTTLFDQNKSVKTIIQREFQISNRFLTKLKLNQKILLNNQIAKVNEIPPLDSTILIKIDFEEDDDIISQPNDLEILYEDEYFLAVNKPADIVVHPCSFHPEKTLANYVKAYLNNKKKIRPINRLDKGTSGVVLFAKNEYIQELFKNLCPRPQKEYFVIAYGKWQERVGTISLPIARKPESLIEREVNFITGQESITHYEVIEESLINQHEIAILRVVLGTGRTHQIRVHMSHLGHPLLGDNLYIGNQNNIDINNQLLTHQALHAYRLQFIHPITKEEINIIAPLPEDMKNVVNSYFKTKI